MSDRDRIDSFLQNIAEGEAAFDDPRTEKEVFLANIANGDENTRNANTREEYWLKQIEGSGGEGNPNYVETIEGTLGSLYSDRFIDLEDELSSNNITAILTINAYTSDIPLIGYVRDSYIVFSGGTTSTYFPYSETYMSVATVLFDYRLAFLEGEIQLYSMMFSDYTTLSVVDTMPCVLTIIHHPLPST